jgi:hypothetical protein
MTAAEKALVWLLRLSAAILLLALLATVMPHAWMSAVHRQMGLGELPGMPIIGYLTRSLSAMYALHGALLLFLSFDVRRYLPLVRFLAAACVVFGLGMLALDVAVAMPLAWTLAEGPSVIVLGGALLGLSLRVGSE